MNNIITKNKPLKTFYGHNGYIVTIGVKKNSILFASGSDDSTIKLWNFVGGRPLIRTFTQHRSCIMRVLFSKNNNWLFSCSLDSTIKIWNIYSGLVIKEILGHSNAVFCLAITPKENILISGGGD